MHHPKGIWLHPLNHPELQPKSTLKSDSSSISSRPSIKLKEILAKTFTAVAEAIESGDIDAGDIKDSDEEGGAHAQFDAGAFNSTIHRLLQEPCPYFQMSTPKQNMSKTIRQGWLQT